MEQSVWKYPLEIKKIQQIIIPVESEILTIQIQDNIPTLWALVRPNSPSGRRVIQMTGTGFDDSLRLFGTYINTVQLQDGTVWHYFDIGIE